MKDFLDNFFSTKGEINHITYRLSVLFLFTLLLTLIAFSEKFSDNNKESDALIGLVILFCFIPAYFITTFKRAKSLKRNSAEIITLMIAISLIGFMQTKIMFLIILLITIFLSLIPPK